MQLPEAVGQRPVELAIAQLVQRVPRRHQRYRADPSDDVLAVAADAVEDGHAEPGPMEEHVSVVVPGRGHQQGRGEARQEYAIADEAKPLVCQPSHLIGAKMTTAGSFVMQASAAAAAPQTTAPRLPWSR